ncbi:hypothetical protein [Mycobacterium sp. OAE908]|uniref:hypothetical protein n=1 Tax=Mycobacterium sp. OAE908 TaxID=2817899 RepID=UPI001AE8B37B
MSNGERIRPPWWSKYVNKVLIGVQPLLREFPIKVPTGVGFIKNAGLVTGPNPDEFEALAGRCPLFRLDPVNA